MVSMVDKERMRVVLGEIMDSLKVWWKANAANKLAEATVAAEAAAKNMSVANSVSYAQCVNLLD